MRAFVINLRRSAERREHMRAQLASVGMSAEWVEAVDGRELTDDDRARLVDGEAVARAPGWLRPGIVACALSHLAVYRRILDDGDEAALVLEDDAKLAPAIQVAAEAVAAHLEMAEVALLHTKGVEAPTVLSTHAAVDLPAGFRLLYPLDVEPISATTGYVITRTACTRLSEFIVPVRAGPDSWGWFLSHGVLDRVRCVIPHAVEVRADFKSTIDYVGSARSLRQRLATTVAQRKIFPAYQLLAMRRKAADRRLTKFSVVSERPPYLDD